MNTKITIALLSSFMAVPALAQSTVTLYGLVDEGLDYVSNIGGHSQFQLASGFLQGSRFGLRGSEDLGGGLKAVFQIENGFNASNGKLAQGGLMFGRQAWVGLASDQYGTVTLGRQYDSVVTYLGPTTANGNWGGTFFAHPYDNDNTDNSFRVNNTIKYASPVLAGIKFGGTYSFSNDTNFANNRAYSFGAQYNTGPLLIAAAFLQSNNPSSTATGAITNGGDENFVGQTLRVFGVGGTYTFDSAQVGLSYTNTFVASPTSSGYVGNISPAAGTLNNLRYQNFEINGRYFFKPAFYLGAMYTYTKSNYNTSVDKLNLNYQTVGLMADYALSKRTDVYVEGVYQHVGGDRTGSNLDYAFLFNGLSSSRNQAVTRVGLRHKF